MAGQIYELTSMSFVGTDTVNFVHNLDREQVGVMVIVDGAQQNANITAVELDAADPRNALTVSLNAPMSGNLVLVDTDYIFSAIPTPAEKAALQTSVWFGSDYASAGPSALQQTTSGFFYLTAVTLTTTFQAGLDYRVGWTVDLSQDTGSGVDYRVRWSPPGGGTITRNYTNVERQPRIWNPRSSFFEIPGAAAGVHTFSLSFKADRNNRNVRANGAFMSSWRVG